MLHAWDGSTDAAERLRLRVCFLALGLAARPPVFSLLAMPAQAMKLNNWTSVLQYLMLVCLSFLSTCDAKDITALWYSKSAASKMLPYDTPWEQSDPCSIVPQVQMVDFMPEDMSMKSSDFADLTSAHSWSCLQAQCSLPGNIAEWHGQKRDCNSSMLVYFRLTLKGWGGRNVPVALLILAGLQRRGVRRCILVKPPAQQPDHSEQQPLLCSVMLHVGKHEATQMPNVCTADIGI